MKKGTVVVSLRGRDKNLPMCVTGDNGSRVLVCNGKERPLARPKLKNPKHIKEIGSCLSDEQMLTDRAIRKALKFISEA